ncbi:MAG: hypothetical protein S4CHLAM81_02700 [Chlamydiales bacterium]|nr:hypothetical protein [Chlamydiales bacterium]MCH9635061.1 hypothetical protein [Chlamydiales bacterium]
MVCTNICNAFFDSVPLVKEILNKYLARDFGKISIEGKFGAERLTPCGLVKVRMMQRRED